MTTQKYMALSKSYLSIISINATNRKEAIEKITEELNKNPSRQAAMPHWVATLTKSELENLQKLEQDHIITITHKES